MEGQQSSSSDGSGGDGNSGPTAGGGFNGFGGFSSELRMTTDDRLRTLEMSFGFLTSQNLMIQTQVGNLSLVFLDVHAKAVNLTNRLQDLEKWKDEVNSRLDAIEMIATTPTLILPSPQPPGDSSSFGGNNISVDEGVAPSTTVGPKKRVRKSRAKTPAPKTSASNKKEAVGKGGRNSKVEKNKEEAQTAKPDDEVVTEVKPVLETTASSELVQNMEVASPSRSLTTVDSIISLVITSGPLPLNKEGDNGGSEVMMDTSTTVNEENMATVPEKKKRVRAAAARASKAKNSGPTKSKRSKSGNSTANNENVFQFPEVVETTTGKLSSDAILGENHTQVVGNLHRCEICRSNFGTEEELLTHGELHALVFEDGKSSLKRMYACKICSREFKTAYHLKSHQIIHIQNAFASAQLDGAAVAVNIKKE